MVKLRAGYTPATFAKRVAGVAKEKSISTYDALWVVIDQEGIEPEIAGRLIRGNAEMLNSVTTHAQNNNVIKKDVDVG